MSLDTKYRPKRYADVLGQDATIEICKEIVRKGHGFNQSYVFAGGHGEGKTTLGRILGRALLCENPKDGEPCDECHSCKSMLADEAECFIEVDAATNSGKEHIRRITEEAQFGSFSGNRKVWLFDECFTEDTMLVTPEGPRSIRDLVEQRYDGLVASLDPDTGEQCWKPVTNWYDIEDERDCVTLEFDNGVVLTVTTDQEIFTTNRGWIPASELTEDDDVCETSLRPQSRERSQQAAAAGAACLVVVSAVLAARDGLHEDLPDDRPEDGQKINIIPGVRVDIQAHVEIITQPLTASFAWCVYA